MPASTFLSAEGYRLELASDVACGGGSSRCPVQSPITSITLGGSKCADSFRVYGFRGLGLRV